MVTGDHGEIPPFKTTHGDRRGVVVSEEESYSKAAVGIGSNLACSNFSFPSAEDFPNCKANVLKYHGEFSDSSTVVSTPVE